ncbi:hypothetical protein BDK51DRAFT_47806 [Blyttiomyces helicus]|uniref:Uncharacterized protein n=1 Tax=Blyttiomyces helicus TaxID=388810 RepID=A0A4P9WEV1_9FUNG|nr:hypothetical protein BDK51DRAFT_47806 [Blyttiomyces helicus]|eukprot:RKO88936.1 hypothetical protein BDK51DRAFT_47806 [Blyttiomyces helicus]
MPLGSVARVGLTEAALPHHRGNSAHHWDDAADAEVGIAHRRRDAAHNGGDAMDHGALSPDAEVGTAHHGNPPRIIGLTLRLAPRIIGETLRIDGSTPYTTQPHIMEYKAADPMPACIMATCPPPAKPTSAGRGRKEVAFCMECTYNILLQDGARNQLDLAHRVAYSYAVTGQPDHARRIIDDAHAACPREGVRNAETILMHSRAYAPGAVFSDFIDDLEKLFEKTDRRRTYFLSGMLARILEIGKRHGLLLNERAYEAMIHFEATVNYNIEEAQRLLAQRLAGPPMPRIHSYNSILLGLVASKFAPVTSRASS